MKLKAAGWGIAFVASVSFATGSEHGNGGNVLVCEQDGVRSVVLYDYYESKERNSDWSLDLGGADLEVNAKVEMALDRLALVNPSRAKLYKEWFKEFLTSSVTEFTEHDLVDLPDIGAGTVPVNCKVKSAAQQRQEPLPGDRRYLVDKKLWNLMNKDHRAGLVLHEMVYREAAILGHEDSAATRYLNGLISSLQFASISYSSFVELVTALKFHTFDSPKGLTLSTNEARFENGRLVSALPVDSVMSYYRYFPTRPHILYGHEVPFRSHFESLIYFRSDGTVEMFKSAFDDVPRYGSTSLVPFECPEMKGHLYAVNGFLHLDEAGRLERVDDLYAVHVDNPNGTYTDWGAFSTDWTNEGSRIQIKSIEILPNGCPSLKGLMIQH